MDTLNMRHMSSLSSMVPPVSDKSSWKCNANSKSGLLVVPRA